MTPVRAPKRAAALVGVLSLLALTALPPMAAADDPAQPPATPRPAVARPLTADELGKLNKLIADRGKETRLNNETTNLLGLTRNDELVASRGIAVNDQQGDIHQFEPLSDDRGYLLLRLNPQKNLIYWVNKDFTLVSARARVPGQSSTEIAAVDARPGVNEELVFWAAFADAQQ